MSKITVNLDSGLSPSAEPPTVVYGHLSVDQILNLKEYKSSISSSISRVGLWESGLARGGERAKEVPLPFVTPDLSRKGLRETCVKARERPYAFGR